MASKSIAKRPNGKYRARYRDSAGNERARHFVRKTDAQRWLDEVTTAVVSGQYVDPKVSQITFGQWFNRWSSQQGWEPGTMQTAETVAGSLIAAVAEPVIAQDPSRNVRLPTRARRSQTAIDAEEIPRTELRLGEAAGLRVQDVTFLARTVRVDQQVQGATRSEVRVRADCPRARGACRPAGRARCSPRSCWCRSPVSRRRRPPVQPQLRGQPLADSACCCRTGHWDDAAQLATLLRLRADRSWL